MNQRSIWLENSQAMSSRANRLRERARDMFPGPERDLVEAEADRYQLWAEDHLHLHVAYEARKRDEERAVEAEAIGGCL